VSEHLGCSLVGWFVGSLVRWFVGSLVRWFVLTGASIPHPVIPAALGVKAVVALQASDPALHSEGLLFLFAADTV
jgi:hypothetical protein